MTSTVAVQATFYDGPLYSCGRCSGHISSTDLFYPTKDFVYCRGERRMVAFHPFIPGVGCIVLRRVTESMTALPAGRVNVWRILAQVSSWHIHSMKSIRGPFKTYRRAMTDLAKTVSRVERENGVPA